jgi:hypothetical protein
MSQITLAEAESIDIRLSAAQTAFRHRATKELKILPWRDATATDSRRDSIRASGPSIFHVKDNVWIPREIFNMQSLDRKRSALSDFRILQLPLHSLPLPVRRADEKPGQGGDYSRGESRHQTIVRVDPINRLTNPVASERYQTTAQDYQQYLSRGAHVVDLFSIVSAFLFMIVGMGGIGQSYEDMPRQLQPLLGLVFLWLGFWLLVASIGTLFHFAPSSEALLLRPIVRTRFQFVGAALVAVEMNDLLGSIAFFGHSVSPSEIIPIVSVFWLSSAEVPSSPVASASCYRLAENVFLFPVVEPELKLIQVQRQNISC